MARQRYIVLAGSLAAIVFGLSTHPPCRGEEAAPAARAAPAREGSPPTTRSDQAGSAGRAGSAGSPGQPGGPATQPVEFMDAGRIFEKLSAGAGGKYAPVVTKVGNGQFDWSRRTVRVAGQAKAEGRGTRDRLMALRAAEVVAKRNALQLAVGLPIDAKGRVGSLRAGEIDVDGEVRGATQVTKQFDADSRTAVVTIEVPMAGLSGVVRIQPATGGAPGEGRRSPRPWTWVVAGAAAGAAEAAPLAEESELILMDVRKLSLKEKFSPVLAPRLESPDGQTVFEVAPDNKAIVSGERHAFVFVSYVGDADSPLPTGQFKKVIVLMPVRADGESLVLSEQDLSTLTRHADARELLRAGRAVIVLREEKAER